MTTTTAREAPNSWVPDLAGHIAALDTALAAGAAQLDPLAVNRTREVLAKVGERSRLGAQTTVVALVGATGSGKSSLFNAIAGLEIAEAGATRPTTSKPLACIWGRDVADPVLDYVDVPRRHRMERESVLDGDREVPLHGLVLLDLPDHDSTSVQHRIEVDRLVGLVDLMIWVVDPQKYADEALHARYLKRLAGHEDVMLVVLNQIDRLSRDDVDVCRRDLRRLLDADGLSSVRLLTSSAVRGDGVDKLRSILGEVVHRQTVVPQRLAADLHDVTRGLIAGVAPSEPDISGTAASGELVAALSDAAAAPVVLDAVAAQYRRQARRLTGWPPARWVGLLRRDPVKKLQLGATEEAARQLARSAPAEATPVQQAGVAAAVEKVTAAASAGLPARWAEAVRSAVPSWHSATETRDADRAGPGRRDAAGGLGAALDRAVAGVDLGTPRRTWWRIVHAVQWLALLALVGGLAWFAAARFGDLADPSLGELATGDPIPVSTVVAAAGAGVGLLATLLSRWWVSVGARRRRARAEQELTAAIEVVARERVVGPVTEVLEAHRRTREALDGSR